MDRGEKIAIAIVAAAALFAGGWWLIPQHGVFREPHSATKTFAIVAIAFTALAAPFAIGEGVSDRHFRRAAARVRGEAAWAREAPYTGPLGRGVAFEAPDRRVLVLHPVGGLGAPRVVEEPREPDAPVVLVPEEEPRASSPSSPGDG